MDIKSSIVNSRAIIMGLGGIKKASEFLTKCGMDAPDYVVRQWNGRQSIPSDKLAQIFVVMQANGTPLDLNNLITTREEILKSISEERAETINARHNKALEQLAAKQKARELREDARIAKLSAKWAASDRSSTAVATPPVAPVADSATETPIATEPVGELPGQSGAPLEGQPASEEPQTEPVKEEKKETPKKAVAKPQTPSAKSSPAKKPSKK